MTMAPVQTFLVVLCCFCAASSQPRDGPTCFECHDAVKHPRDCHDTHPCGREDYCATELVGDPAHSKWRFRCINKHECLQGAPTSLVGKKRAPEHPGPEPHEEVLYRQCCTTNLCNKNVSTISIVPAGKHESPSCYDCPYARHPNDCDNHHQCGHDEVCGTEVHDDAMGRHWKYFCMPRHECHSPAVVVLFGRKRKGGHHEPPPPEPPTCQNCCTAELCNKDLCLPPTASSAPATAINAASTTNMVTTTTATALSTRAVTMATDTASPPSAVTMATGTASPTSAVSTTTATASPTSAATQAATTTAFHFPCVDFNSACHDLKLQGHCDAVPGNDYETMKLRCRLTCGFCKR